MLPTVRRYSQTASYSQMNLTDLFAQVMLRPAPSLGLRLDVHRIELASPRDHWYFGSGATQSRGTMFGFGTLRSNGRADLGTATEISAEYTSSRNWSINAFLGAVRGGDLVRTNFRNRTLTFGYIETVLQYLKPRGSASVRQRPRLRPQDLSCLLVARTVDGVM